MIFIDPHCNYTAGIMNDKWIAPRPGTDAALAEAIAYVWLTEGTYDKEYVADRTVGFEEFQKSILGENDGVPAHPRLGRGEMRHPGPGHLGARPRMGVEAHHPLLPACAAAWAAPAVKPTATNGPG